MKERNRQIRDDKKRVKEIYQNKCANFDQCQSKEKPHIHHIIFRCQCKDGVPIKQIENKGNYVALCFDCERLTHELAG